MGRSLTRQDLLANSSLLVKIMEHGDQAIHLFFVLSGFLITRILIQEINQRGKIDFKHFYVKRVFRLIPASLVYLLTIAVLNLVHWLSTSWLGIVGALLFFRNYIPATGWYSGHFWSLSVEEHFYLLWPVILFVLPIKRRLMLTLGVLALSIMFRELEYGQNFHTLAIREIKISYRTDYVLSFLLWGCALATLFEEAKFINMAKKLFFPGSIAVVLGLQIVATLSEHRLAFVAQGILFCGLITATLLHPNRWFARFLETSWMVRIGLVSYSLYIWQQLFLSYRVEDSPLGWLQIFPVNLVAAFVAAFASYYWIEQPCRHFGRRLFMATNERTIYKRPDTSESKP